MTHRQKWYGTFCGNFEADGQETLSFFVVRRWRATIKNIKQQWQDASFKSCQVSYFLRIKILTHWWADRACVSAVGNIANSAKNQTLAFFEGLTSSDVLIFIFKANLIVLYKSVNLSRSIRPNKYPKIECQIWSKARLSTSLSFFLLRGEFKRRKVVPQSGM